MPDDRELTRDHVCYDHFDPLVTAFQPGRPWIVPHRFLIRAGRDLPNLHAAPAFWLCVVCCYFLADATESPVSGS